MKTRQLFCCFFKRWLDFSLKNEDFKSAIQSCLEAAYPISWTRVFKGKSFNLFIMKYSVLEYGAYIYFFHGKVYYKYSKTLKEICQGRNYIADRWNGVFEDFDSCFRYDSDYVIFFKGQEYQKFSFTADKPVEQGKITDWWKGLTFTKIEAAYRHQEDEWIYFFSGGACCIYSETTKEMKTLPISEMTEPWKEILVGKLDTLVMIDKVLYCFKENDFMCFDFTKEKGQIDKGVIHKKWKGVPKLKHSEEFRKKCDCCSEKCYGKFEGHTGVRCWERPICCRGVHKQYICCGSPYGSQHYPKDKSTHPKGPSNEPVINYDCDSKACECPKDCSGGYPGDPPCNKRKMCCRGWPKKYRCCKLSFENKICSGSSSEEEKAICRSSGEEEVYQIYVVSDVHLKLFYQNKDNDFDPTLNFIDFLKHVQVAPKVKELILLGDIFDVWVGKLGSPIFPGEDGDYLRALLERKKGLVPVIAELKNIIKAGKKVVYVLGNHDDRITKEAFAHHIPGLEFQKEYYKAYNTFFIHGNAFDIFNRKFTDFPVPLGYFITRCAAQYGVTQEGWIAKTFGPTVFGRLYSDFATANYDRAKEFIVMMFCEACGKKTKYYDKEIKNLGIDCGNYEATVKEIVDQYFNLFWYAEAYYYKRGIKHGSTLSIQAAVGNMGIFAKWCIDKYGVKNVVMGHTHNPKLCKASGRRYVNSGKFPDVVVCKVVNRAGTQEIVDFATGKFAAGNVTTAPPIWDGELDDNFRESGWTHSKTDFASKPQLVEITLSSKDSIRNWLFTQIQDKDKRLPILLTCTKTQEMNYCYVKYCFALMSEKKEDIRISKATITCGCNDELVFCSFAEPVGLAKAYQSVITRLIELIIVREDIVAFVPNPDSPCEGKADLFGDDQEMERMRKISVLAKTSIPGACIAEHEKDKNYKFIAKIKFCFKCPLADPTKSVVGIITPCPSLEKPQETRLFSFQYSEGVWLGTIGYHDSLEYKYVVLDKGTGMMTDIEKGEKRLFDIGEVAKAINRPEISSKEDGSSISLPGGIYTKADLSFTITETWQG